MTPTPNPGSEEALKLGCKCPIIDNHYGEGMSFSNPPCFWVNAACPLHGSLDIKNTHLTETDMDPNTAF